MHLQPAGLQLDDSLFGKRNLPTASIAWIDLLLADPIDHAAWNLAISLPRNQLQTPPTHLLASAQGDLLRGSVSWLDDVEANGHAINQHIDEAPADYGREAMMMGLRLNHGVDLGVIATLAGPMDEWINLAMLDQLEASGMIEMKGDVLRLKDDARPLLNSVLASLLI